MGTKILPFQKSVRTISASFWLKDDEIVEDDMTIEVTCDADYVEADNAVNVTAVVCYFGQAESSEMMIVDVGVPTEFEAADKASLFFAFQKT